MAYAKAGIEIPTSESSEGISQDIVRVEALFSYYMRTVTFPSLCVLWPSPIVFDKRFAVDSCAAVLAFVSSVPSSRIACLQSESKMMGLSSSLLALLAVLGYKDP